MIFFPVHQQRFLINDLENFHSQHDFRSSGATKPWVNKHIKRAIPFFFRSLLLNLHHQLESLCADDNKEQSAK